MTRFDVAFLVARVFALFLFFHLISEVAMAVQLLSRGSDKGQIPMMGIFFAFELLILCGFWFGAGFIARHLITPLKDTTEKAANFEVWQNAALTVLGFYCLYMAVMGATTAMAGMVMRQANDAQEEAGLRQAMNIQYVGIGLRFAFAFVLIFIPHKLSQGLTRLRSGVKALRTKY